MAFRRKINARQNLEWYEGYYVLPDKLRDALVTEERKCGNLKFRVYGLEGISREDCIFHSGVIHSMLGQAEKLQKQANLGARFAGRTFASFDAKRNPSAYNKASLYARNQNLFSSTRNCLLLIGSTGTGKTHLAAAIANALVAEGIPTMFGTFQTHLDEIRKEFDVSGQKQYLDQIKGIPMLVIDDLGKENRTDWTQSILYNVVNYRYEHLLPIIFTSNLMATELANYCGSAVWSRMNEMCDTIIMQGEDYRLR